MATTTVYANLTWTNGYPPFVGTLHLESPLDLGWRIECLTLSGERRSLPIEVPFPVKGGDNLFLHIIRSEEKYEWRVAGVYAHPADAPEEAMLHSWRVYER